MMKRKTIKTEEIKNEDNSILHLSSYEVTKMNKEYIVPANKSVKYSKLDKAKKKEEERIKKELQDYTKYDL